MTAQWLFFRLDSQLPATPAMLLVMRTQDDTFHTGGNGNSRLAAGEGSVHQRRYSGNTLKIPCPCPGKTSSPNQGFFISVTSPN